MLHSVREKSLDFTLDKFLEFNREKQNVICGGRSAGGETEGSPKGGGNNVELHFARITITG